MQTSFGDHPATAANGFELNLRYPEQCFDAETGLHYNYFREHGSKTGRHVQSDTAGLIGGTDTYAYTAGNPMFGSDSLGLMTICKNGKEKTDFDKYPKYLQLAASYIAQSDNLEDAAFVANRIYSAKNDEYQRTGVWTPDLKDHRNAEHYMFSLYWTNTSPDISPTMLIPSVSGYSLYKLIRNDHQ